MTSTRTYTIIFVVLMALSTTQALFEFTGVLNEDKVTQYWLALGVIMVLSTIKAGAVAGWYMHVKDEPRAIAYIALSGLIGVVALTAGAAYSIT
jgi:cytochrome c oxidase subunit 4